MYDNTPSTPVTDGQPMTVNLDLRLAGLVHEYRTAMLNLRKFTRERNQVNEAIEVLRRAYDKMEKPYEDAAHRLHIADTTLKMHIMGDGLSPSPDHIMSQEDDGDV